MSTQKQETKPTRSGTARLGWAVALAVVSLSALPTAQAAEAGMTVVRDADTGKLRAPTAEEFKALEAQRLKSSAGKAEAPRPAPVAVRRPDGSMSVTLDESHMSYAVVTRNADGTLTEQCVTGADAANKAVSGKKVPSAKSASNAKEHGHEHQ